MSGTSWVLYALGSIFAVGLVDLAIARAGHASALLFVFEFRHKLGLLMESGNREIYEWLTLNATRMQAQLGSEGIVSFRPPFANYIVSNYVLVPNALMEIRKCFEDSILSRGSLQSQYAAVLEDALLRHQGTVEERVRRNTRSFLNPLKWLTRGVSIVLGVPVWILQSVGLVSEASGTKFRASRAFQVVSGFSALVGFASAVVGLATGWEPFIALARRVVPYAF